MATPVKEATAQTGDAVEALTAKAIDLKLAAFDRQIKTQREHIAKAEKIIAGINRDKAELIQAATARWSAQLPAEAE